MFRATMNVGSRRAHVSTGAAALVISLTEKSCERPQHRLFQRRGIDCFVMTDFENDLFLGPRGVNRPANHEFNGLSGSVALLSALRPGLQDRDDQIDYRFLESDSCEETQDFVECATAASYPTAVRQPRLRRMTRRWELVAQ